MITEKKRLWLRSVSVLLDDEKASQFLSSGVYDSIQVLSYASNLWPGVEPKTKTTAFIDLLSSEDDMLARMSDTTRNEIRRTYKIPELSFSAPEPVSDDVYSMYLRFEISQGRTPIGRAEMSHYRAIVGRYNGEPFSAVTMIEAKPFLRIRSIFSKRLAADKEMQKVIGYASRRVMWEWCLWGKKNGFEKLDVASVNLTDEGKKGISAFKLSFGGEIGHEYHYAYKKHVFQMLEKLSHMIR